MVVPHSVGTKPQPWQMLGMDVFELVFPQPTQGKVPPRDLLGHAPGVGGDALGRAHERIGH